VKTDEDEKTILVSHQLVIDLNLPFMVIKTVFIVFETARHGTTTNTTNV
jgi:hypothetical protein